MAYRKIRQVLQRELGQPRSMRFLLAGAALIMVPTLFAGFFFDDYVHLLTLRGEETVAAPFDLFCFARGNADTLYPFLNSGPYPWYTLPDLKLHFFRPLSSATMVLDHTLFGETAFLYHVHSLLWYVLLVWGVLLLYRRCMPAALASLCCLLYLVDDGHLIPALWWSNRNAIVAAAPALFGLVAHLRWREEHWRPGLPLSLLGYGLGLLGGETALGIFGYLIAYELLCPTTPWYNRVRALAPAGLLSVAYLLVYKWADFGVRGSGVYLDPIAEWRTYLAAAPSRMTELLGIQFFSLPSELSVVSNALGTLLVAAALMLTLLLGAGLVYLWKSFEPAERRLLLWMGLGSFIATLPVLATFPSGRLLLLPSIGGSVWIGLFIRKGFLATQEHRARLVRLLAGVFIILHLAIAPLHWLGASVAIPTIIHASEDAFREIEIDPVTTPTQRVITLFAADPYTGFYPLVMRQYLGYPNPRSWQTLSLAPFDHEITRTGPNQFEVQVLGGELLSTPFERLMRSEHYPYQPGEVVSLQGFTITILETGVWGPSRFRLTMDGPLESPDYVFLAWQAGRLSPIDWPAIGKSARFSVSDGYFAWRNFKRRLPLM